MQKKVTFPFAHDRHWVVGNVCSVLLLILLAGRLPPKAEHLCTLFLVFLKEILMCVLDEISVHMDSRCLVIKKNPLCDR